MINATAATAALAGISALSAYLNAKYHVAQDLKLVWRKKQAEKYYQKLGTSKIVLL